MLSLGEVSVADVVEALQHPAGVVLLALDAVRVAVGDRQIVLGTHLVGLKPRHVACLDKLERILVANERHEGLELAPDICEARVVLVDGAHLQLVPDQLVLGLDPLPAVRRVSSAGSVARRNLVLDVIVQGGELTQELVQALLGVVRDDVGEQHPRVRGTLAGGARAS